MSKRVVITTFGCFGDLNPYIGLALGLKARGPHPMITTGEIYRPFVEGEEIEFRQIRPDIDPRNSEVLGQVRHPKRRTEYLTREFLCPHLRES